MDINFHYFAVKVLTKKAGFDEADAQLLASYSQFVDDFDTYRYLYFADVPQYAQYLAAKLPYGWCFNPVTTGFNSFFDYVRLSVERNQKRILIPFHFIPQRDLSYIPEDRKEYRVCPVDINESSLLQGILVGAAEAYKQFGDRECLIRIGTLLHIFADTYAHQRFSGFWNWENYAYLEDVRDNITSKNITSNYKPNVYYNAPSIGHPNDNTAPDDSNVSFTMQQKFEANESFPYKATYSRSNVLEFLKCSKVILDYLRSCRNMGPVSEDDWNSLSDKMKQGFLTRDKDISSLSSHWSGIFPDITFTYDKKNLLTDNLSIVDANGEKNKDIEDATEIMMGMFNNNDVEGVLLSGNNDDFFRFNVIADSIRRAVDPAYTVDEDFIKYAEELAMKQKGFDKI